MDTLTIEEWRAIAKGEVPVSELAHKHVGSWTT